MLRVVGFLTKTGIAAGGVVGMTTAPSDLSQFFRSVSAWVDTGGNIEAILWGILVVFGVWALFDVWKWFRGQKGKKTPPALTETDLTGFIKSGGAVTLVEGDQHNYYSLPDGTEFAIPKEVHLSIEEHSHTALTKADGTIETRSSADPGRGDLAATLIKTAGTFAIAAKVFNDWRYSPQPRVPEQAFFAMEERLRTEGETEETVRFLDEHGAWQTSMEWLPPVPMNDPNRYEFALMLFLRQARGEDE